MATEVERKRELPDDGAGLMARLAELGYGDGGRFTEIDDYYSPQHVNYLETVECLRVRQRDGFAEITYKPASDASTHSSSHVISKVETNVVLNGPDQAEPANELLIKVGMVALATVDKQRSLYRHPDNDRVVIAIDRIKGLGAFVEVEVIATDPTEAALVEDIEHELGLGGYPEVKLPYRDLVRKTAG